MLGFVFQSTIMSVYTVVVLKIANIIKSANNRLDHIREEVENGVEVSIEIVDLLRIRNDLLVLCFESLSNVFGIVNLCATVYMLIDIVQMWFFISLVFDNLHVFDYWISIWTIYTSVTWILPQAIIFVMAFTCNSVGEEVSRLRCF